ncbi:MAG: hypothetical protein JSS90_07455 [Bacteroidetes bacterium]|jgi:hypothetical protein|nr:hypothetical protein [Bacteroidota bacterium]
MKSKLKVVSHNLKATSIFIISILLLAACRKEEKFPIEPVLTNITIQQYDRNSFNIITGYTDGDGDLGLSDADTLPPFDKNSKYYHNYFCTFSQLTNGNWQEINFAVPYYYRLPLLTPVQRNKNIKGNITVDIKNFMSPISNGVADTFRAEVYIADRALHESNTVISSPFVIVQ